MLSFSSQPHFLCPPCEGGHGNLFVQKGPLFVVRLLGFWGFFFFKHCRSLGEGKSKEEWPWLSKTLCWLRFQCWTLPCFLFVLEMLFGGPGGFPISAADLFRALLLFPPFFFFFGGRGGTFSFSPGWMDTLCSQGVEGLLPLGFSGIDDTLWTRI